MSSKLLSALLITIGTLVLPISGKSAVWFTSDRVIINAGEKSGSLDVQGDQSKTFLLQTWFTNTNSQEIGSFATLPQLAIVQPKRSQKLRFIYQGTGLPEDRESRVWINIQTIAAIKKSSLEGNLITPAITQTINLYYRPKALQGLDRNDANSQLKWTVTKSSSHSYTFNIENPSPFNVYFDRLFIVDRSLHTSSLFGVKGNIGFLAPFESKEITVEQTNPNFVADPKDDRQVWFTTSNDAGFTVAYYASIDKNNEFGKFNLFKPEATTHEAPPESSDQSDKAPLAPILPFDAPPKPSTSETSPQKPSYRTGSVLLGMN